MHFANFENSQSGLKHRQMCQFVEKYEKLRNTKKRTKFANFPNSQNSPKCCQMCQFVEKHRKKLKFDKFANFVNLQNAPIRGEIQKYPCLRNFELFEISKITSKFAKCADPWRNITEKSKLASWQVEWLNLGVYIFRYDPKVICYYRLEVNIEVSRDRRLVN